MGVAPMLCAASMMLGSSSRRLLSTRRATNGKAAMTSGTMVALVPTVVPMMRRESGKTMIIRIRNGIERSRLIRTFSTLISQRGKRQHAVPFAHHEQHAQRQTDHDGEGRGEKRNIEGFPDGGRETAFAALVGQLLDGLGREKTTVHRRSPPRPEDFRSRSEIPTRGQTAPPGTPSSILP